MRFFLAALLFLTLPLAPAFAQESCARAADRELRLTNSDRPERITARSSGPSCAQTIVVWTLRDARGDPLFVFASTFSDMTNNPVDHPVSTDVMDNFLRAWVRAPIQSSEPSLPDWPDGAESLGASAPAGASYDTPYERETYLALRARNLPLLCVLNSAESEQCLIVDPISHAPTVILFRARPSPG